MTLRNSLLFISLTLIAGCAKEDSSKVKQDSIFTTYNVNYDANNNTLLAEAIFNFGGSTGTYLKLDGVSTITFDGEALSEDTNFIGQVIYKLEKSMLTPSEIWKAHTFFYRNNDGNEFTNPITLPFLVSVQYQNTVIKTTSTLVANWNSIDQIGNDALYLSISSQDRQKNRWQYAKDGSQNATSGVITVPQDLIAELGPGTFNVRICREDTGSTTQAPAKGGYITLSTCSTVTTITIEI